MLARENFNRSAYATTKGEHSHRMLKKTVQQGRSE
jgi:hypothetical protein